MNLFTGAHRTLTKIPCLRASVRGKSKVPIYRLFSCYSILLAVFLFSCGIEEYYFLPQIPQTNITTTGNTGAVINLPPISQYYYATNYSIFYRVYISDFLTDSSISQSQRAQINPSLASDFNALEPVANPANASAVTSSNTFRNRNFFELEFDGESISSVLPADGGRLNIVFPTARGDFPTVSFDGGQEIRLRRSSNLTSPEPRDDLSFRNTPELNSYANAVSTINADVAGRSGNSQYAYVSMYIVAVGYDNTLFTQIYSKPTHISIFKLPDSF